MEAVGGQFRFVGKLNFAISRMLTLVLVLGNKAFYGWKGHVNSPGNTLPSQDGKSKQLLTSGGIAKINTFNMYWKIQGWWFPYVLRGNLHRTDAKFVMDVSSWWERAQLPAHAHICGVHTEVNRQPWGLVLGASFTFCLKQGLSLVWDFLPPFLPSC